LKRQAAQLQPAAISRYIRSQELTRLQLPKLLLGKQLNILSLLAALVVAALNLLAAAAVGLVATELELFLHQ
jgi:hypothetical protein